VGEGERIQEEGLTCENILEVQVGNDTLKGVNEVPSTETVRRQEQ
jgi:hypothetical protein